MEVRVVAQVDVEAWPAGHPNERLGYVGRVVLKPGNRLVADKTGLEAWVQAHLVGIVSRIEEVLTCERPDEG